MAVDFYDIFAPCAILYPFSLTAASTSRKKIHQWAIYRVYMLLCYLAVVGALLVHVYIYIFIDGVIWNLVNTPSVLTLHVIYFTIFLYQSMKGAKKDKLEKLMNEINENYDIHFSINNRKYKIYNAVFALVLLVYHVGSTIIRIVNTEGRISYLVPVTFTSIIFDAELNILTNFVCVLSAKIAQLVLKLENIVKKKEASRKDLYEWYRHGLNVVKRINGIWNVRILVMIVFELCFTTRSVLKLFAKNDSMTDVMSVFTVLSKYCIIIRHFLICIQLGLLGQWISEKFNQINQLASTISDMHLGDELNHQTTKICRLAAVCPSGLYAGGSVIDGQLPLRVVSAVISSVILILQFGFAVY